MRLGFTVQGFRALRALAFFIVAGPVMSRAYPGSIGQEETWSKRMRLEAGLDWVHTLSTQG